MCVVWLLADIQCKPLKCSLNIDDVCAIEGTIRVWWYAFDVGQDNTMGVRTFEQITRQCCAFVNVVLRHACPIYNRFLSIGDSQHSIVARDSPGRQGFDFCHDLIDHAWGTSCSMKYDNITTFAYQCTLWESCDISEWVHLVESGGRCEGVVGTSGGWIRAQRFTILTSLYQSAVRSCCKYWHTVKSICLPLSISRLRLLYSYPTTESTRLW